MKTVYFVRHGESQANLDGLVAGGEFESPLTEKGKVQAKQAGQELKTKKIGAIVGSPMGRTRDTAEIIAKVIGYDPKKIIYDEAFIEVYNGHYSGKPYSVRDQHIEEGKAVDLENPDQVYARVHEGFARLRKLPVDRIVLVSHGATGRMIRAIVKNIPLHDFMSHEKFGNSEIYEFEI